MNAHDFGNFLTLLRKEKGLTQKQLSEKINITDKAVSRWETGKNYPDIEILEQLAEEFDVTINELLEGRRISKEEFISVSENQVVEQIKTNKKNKKKLISIIAVLLSIVILASGYIALVAFGIFEGEIRRKMYNCSRDAITVLDSINTDAGKHSPEDRNNDFNDLKLRYLSIDIKPDKTTTGIALSGSTLNDTYFTYNVFYEVGKDTGYAKVSKSLNEYNPSVTYFYLTEFRDIISQLDFSLFENFDEYGINFDGTKDIYLDKEAIDPESISFANSPKILIWRDNFWGDHRLQEYNQELLTGRFFVISVYGHWSRYTVDLGAIIVPTIYN